ncbi:MAG: ThiF family adenylyltransferase [Lachnospiraceae bacterium]|nr:ThiF family adenylyltransferase [Lachnospiraceae bacterium]
MNAKDERFSRLVPLFSEEGIEKLNKSHVAVFGIGGVGGFVCEALARGGVGEITIVDHDTVAESNLNRQIL